MRHWQSMRQIALTAVHILIEMNHKIQCADQHQCHKHQNIHSQQDRIYIALDIRVGKFHIQSQEYTAKQGRCHKDHIDQSQHPPG